jgi:hypothetical protein
MPRIELTAADTPFGERLGAGFSYPVRGAGLATCVVLALIHYVGLLPSYIGVFGTIVAWAATWRYAADCLLHTAHGYADPPDVGNDSDASGWGLTAIHLLIVALCALSVVFFPHLLWPVLIVSALVLPAIDMSLAFDGNMVLAINPLNWMRIALAFGPAYLVPVGINLLLAILIVLASIASAALPKLLALPLFAFGYTYLIVLAFHLMGAMIHQRHEQFGIEPEAPKLAMASGQDADDLLLHEVAALAPDQPDVAIQLLVARLQDRAAPASVHLAYRQLLKRQNLHDGLLVHGQIWMAALIAAGESRRALGVLQDCIGLDPHFIPDDPRTCNDLAQLAARSGMNRLVIQLGEGCLARWPRDPQSVAPGLLAARALAEHPDQHARAIGVLDLLQTNWPDHPLRGEILAVRQQLRHPA